VDVEDFKEAVKSLGLGKGVFISCQTLNSVCTGYFLEACYQTSQGGFINVAATRKIGQGRGEQDWFDHTYSIPISRITSVKVIDSEDL